VKSYVFRSLPEGLEMRIPFDRLRFPAVHTCVSFCVNFNPDCSSFPNFPAFWSCHL
jgi:hypothetical protein